MFNPKNYLKTILTIVAVILASILLYQNSSLFKFFFKNIFISEKTYLEKTVLAIKEVNNISEWITAEYYGEVLYSLKEHQELQKIRQDTQLIPYDQIETLNSLFFWKDTARTIYFQEHLRLHHEGKKYRDYKDSAKLFDNPLFHDLRYILNAEEKKTYNFIKNNALYSDKFNEKVSARIGKKEREIEKKLDKEIKKELVLLGRGWIKAGFGLDSLDMRQFKSEVRTDTLIISGMPAPHIISSHINPWFIPRKLKGYEIVFIKKEKKIKPEEITLVKAGCLQKLQQNALETGLIEEAWTSAEESALGMLQLMGETKIKAVRFER